MTSAPDAAAPLRREGFTQDEIDALHLLWKKPQFRTFLNMECSEIAQYPGGTPTEAYSAKKHRLDNHAVGNFMWHGFTAHQTWVLTTHPVGKAVFESMDEEVRDEFLQRPVPRDHMVNLVLTSDAAGDFHAGLHRWERAAAGCPVEDGDTAAYVEEATATLVALDATIDDACGFCP
jgi:hypothetical protein